MGVYIHNMEMPKNCGICPFCVPEADEDRGDICVLCGQFPLVKDEKSCECPLVPVPPHGDLIDRTATVGKICAVGEMIEERLGYDKGAPYYAAALYIQDNKTDFPTIIPTEEGE